MKEKKILTKTIDSDIKIINDSALEESVSLKKDNSPQDMLLKEKPQLKKPLCDILMKIHGSD